MPTGAAYKITRGSEETSHLFQVTDFTANLDAEATFDTHMAEEAEADARNDDDYSEMAVLQPPAAVAAAPLHICIAGHCLAG